MASDRVKVFFPIASPAAHQSTGEWLWAEHMGNEQYRIDNLPFEIYDISLGDVVSAAEVDGALTFHSIAVRGGHSTYRIRLPKHATHEDFLEVWPQFEAHKCSYEGASGERKLYSIDVPLDADIFAVYDLLERGEKTGKFKFEEAHYCKPQDRH